MADRTDTTLAEQMSVEELKSLARMLTDASGNPAYTMVVQSPAGLPDRIRRELGDNFQEACGVYDPESDSVFLVAENVRNPEHAVAVWAHEQIVHHGLRSLMTQEERNDLLDRLWERSGGLDNPDIDELCENYGLDPQKDTDSRRFAAEEYLASLAEKKSLDLLNATERSLWEMVVESVKKAVDRVCSAVTGRPMHEDTDALLSSLGRHVLDGRGNPARGYGVTEHAMPALRTRPAPENTITAYKLFRVDQDRPGNLYPLFVDAQKSVPMGAWIDAEEGPMAKPTKTGRMQVKSELGTLAFRPGWHAGDAPCMYQVGLGKMQKKRVNGEEIWQRETRADNHVWAEVSLAADVSYQAEADRNGINARTGNFVNRDADIKRIPEDGFYRYKTSPTMRGKWIISGSMKVNRVLTDKEVEAINKGTGFPDLPRKSPLVLEKLGFDSETGQALNRKQEKIRAANPSQNMEEGMDYLEAVRNGTKLKDVPVDERTPEVCSEAVKNNPWNFRDVPENLKTEALCRKAVRKDGHLLDDVPENMRTKKLCDRAIESTREAFVDEITQYIPDNVLKEELREGKLDLRQVDQARWTEEICMAAVQKDPFRLMNVPEDLKTYEMCLESVRGSASNIKRVPEKFLDQKMCDAVMENTCTKGEVFDAQDLLYVPEKFLTEEICLFYAQQADNALQYIPEEKRSEKVCMEAVKNNPSNLRHIPKTYDQMEFCLESAARFPWILENPHRKMFENDLPREVFTPEFKEKALAANAEIRENYRKSVAEGMPLKEVPWDYRNFEICTEAVAKSADNLPDIQGHLMCRDFCLKCVEKNGESLAWLPKESLTDYVVHEAVRNSGKALRLVPEESKTTELCFAAVSNDPQALEFVPEKNRTAEVCSRAWEKAETSESRELVQELIPSWFKDRHGVPLSASDMEKRETALHNRAEIIIENNQSVIDTFAKNVEDKEETLNYILCLDHDDGRMFIGIDGFDESSNNVSILEKKQVSTEDLKKCLIEKLDAFDKKKLQQKEKKQSLHEEKTKQHRR